MSGAADTYHKLWGVGEGGDGGRGDGSCGDGGEDGGRKANGPSTKRPNWRSEPRKKRNGLQTATFERTTQTTVTQLHTCITVASQLGGTCSDGHQTRSDSLFSNA